jgi:hypothetical protein
MSGALVVLKQKLPVYHGPKLSVQALLPKRRRTKRTASPGMYPEADRSGLIVIGDGKGIYGRDARIITTLPPGLIIDIYV